jgi:hypothetical protein
VLAIKEINRGLISRLDSLTTLAGVITTKRRRVASIYGPLRGKPKY